MGKIGTGEIIGIAAGGLILVYLISSRSSATTSPITTIPYNPNATANALAAQAAAQQAAAAAATQNQLVSSGASVINTFLNNIFG